MHTADTTLRLWSVAPSPEDRGEHADSEPEASIRAFDAQVDVFIARHGSSPEQSYRRVRVRLPLLAAVGQ